MIYAFEQYELDVDRFQLRLDADAIHLEPRVFDLLVYLVRNRDRVVSKRELLQHVWSGDVVTEAVLHRTTNLARKALGDSGGRGRYIATIRGRGYRFVAPVQEREERVRGEAAEAFVGRAADLAALEAALDRASEGQGQLAFVLGEPGIGKTRLVEELARIAVERGARVVTSHCLDAHAQPALWPWQRILREVGAPLPPAGEAEPGAPPLATLLPLAMRVIEASWRRPLVVVLEDLHWADGGSLALLELVAQEMKSSSLLVIGTLRDTEHAGDHPGARALSSILRHAYTHPITLSGLYPSEIGQFVQRALGRAAPRALVETLREKTGGNPFFLREALRWLATKGLLGSPEFVPSWNIELPPLVHDVILHRLDALPNDGRALLRTAAVAGAEFQVDVLAAAAGVKPADALATLDAAASARIVEAREGGVRRFGFAHALVREALYQGLTGNERAELHLRVLHALEAQLGDRADEQVSALAWHAFEAAPLGVLDRALAYAERAAERAAQLGAHAEQARQCERIAQLLELQPETDRATLLHAQQQLGRTQLAAGNFEGSRRAFARAASLARSLGDAEAFAHAALGYGAWGAWQAAPDPVLHELTEEALTRLPETDSALRARLLARRCGLPGSGPPAQLARPSREALAMARSAGDDEAVSEALQAVHYALGAPEALEERRALAREILQLGAALDRPDLGFPFRLLVQGDHLRAGDLAAFRQASEALRSMHHPAATFQALMGGAGRALLAGRYERAKTLIHEAYTLGQRIGHDFTMPAFIGQSYVLLRDTGDLDGIRNSLDVMVGEYAWTGPYMQSVAPGTHLELDEREAAREAFERAARHDFADLPRRADWVIALAELARVCAYLRDRPRAETLFGLLQPFAAQHAVHPEPLLYAGPVTRALALLAHTLGRPEQAADFFADALARAGALGAAPVQARLRLEYGSILAEEGDPAGRELLLACVREAERMGLRLVAERARGVLGAGPA